MPRGGRRSGRPSNCCWAIMPMTRPRRCFGGCSRDGRRSACPGRDRLAREPSCGRCCICAARDSSSMRSRTDCPGWKILPTRTRGATGTSSATRSCPASRPASRAPSISCRGLCRMRSPLRARACQSPALRRGRCARGCAWGVSDRFVREILRQAHAAPDANPLVRLPGGDTVRRYGENLYRVPCLPMRDVRESENRRIEVGRAEQLPQGTIRWCRGQVGLLAGADLTVRYRSGGECFAPAGRGVSKRLKTLFQEHRIPPWQRDVWPLLFSGDVLAAVPGVAVAEEFAVSGGWCPEWTPVVLILPINAFR